MNVFLNSYKNTECSKRSGKQNAEFGMSNLETVNQGAADWCMEMCGHRATAHTATVQDQCSDTTCVPSKLMHYHVMVSS